MPIDQISSERATSGRQKRGSLLPTLIVIAHQSIQDGVHVAKEVLGRHCVDLVTGPADTVSRELDSTKTIH